MKSIQSLSEAVELSLDHGSTCEYDADFEVKLGAEKYHVYAVAISERDILCYTEEASINFLVDTFGDCATAEIFNVEYSEEV